MDTYSKLYSFKANQSEIQDTIHIADSDVQLDSTLTDSTIITDMEIVDPDIVYDNIDRKVTEIESNKKAIDEKHQKETTSNKSIDQTTVQNPISSSTVYQSDADGKFLVMAGSFLLKENADALVSKLKKMGYADAKVVVFTSSQYHSVLAARYNSEEKARSISVQLKQKGVDNFVKVSQ